MQQRKEIPVYMLGNLNACYKAGITVVYFPYTGLFSISGGPFLQAAEADIKMVEELKKKE